MRRHGIAVAILAAIATVGARRLQPSVPTERGAAVDQVFAKWTTATPGCAVSVSTDGTPVLAKGYGMADLEHDVTITPETIFEAGSVSKQFTAAAVLLLARDHKLSIDDPVRKYVPELPDYSASGLSNPRGGDGGPITIRHILTHTSGLRDWGSVAAIANWPRGTRVHTHAHVLDIVSRQRALNFPAGERWSYSNTGFNLAAIIVSRVSGMPFADFTRDRIFKPLEMTHTSWRDDYTRIVKGRAVAYEERDGVFHTDMPFENIYGNGGLLTTVGDLLKWNENFSKPVVGDAAFVEEEQRPGHFNDGRVHGYALGLFVGPYKGLREVSHSGSTGGYSSFLTRYPDERVSVAVLCNVATSATQLAHQVADVFLQGKLKAAPTPTYTLAAADKTRLAGLYLSTETSAVLPIAESSDGMRIENGPPLAAKSAMVLTTPDDRERFTFDGNGHLAVVDSFGTTDRLIRATRVSPSATALSAYAGVYESDEAEAVIAAKVDGDRLVLTQRPDRRIVLTPLVADVFMSRGLGVVRFRRDSNDRVTAFSVSQDRVWDLRFKKTRTAGQPTTTGRLR
jgi:CubicO group peptidase (beta-lactamase class C family)